MITGLFIFDGKGDVLMSKLYKDGVKGNVSDVFRIQVISSNNKTSSSKEVRSPILTLGSTSFIYIKSGKIWLVAVTRSNQDCAAILEFLYKFETLLKSTFNADSVITDELIINNFFGIYQLLDEIVQFGYPINLEPTYLKAVLPGISMGDGFKLNNTLSRRKSNGGSFMLQSNRSGDLNAALSSITWRQQGLKYRRNEIFVNVDEKINVLTNEQSEILRAYVDGKIVLKTHLSGIPECRFGLNDDGLVINTSTTKLGAEHTGSSNQNNVVLEDCKFHQCVELSTFDTNRVIQFIPPDGEFQLMTYNCVSNINLPFKVIPQVQQVGSTRLQYKLSIKSLFPAKLNATEVKISIPTPQGVIKHYTSESSGKAKFSGGEDLIIWKFNKFFGDQEHVLTAEVELSEDSVHSMINWSRPPIKLDFVIDMFSCSGLSVNYVRIQEKSNYRTVKWVKYRSQSGSYDIRY
ncbi:clathrin associated protein complex medium subunit [Yamadazyma tenuis]|uniref:MHD domain-containing protein n=1 Tax=Candida tenuis (strain ATCC 10573 / BCRC 21748 / CBS 615 / JCM 9827 / NBRC 10315 / NRRL Y-1498 / VKM Y-70) TaxID=590646 RepID=G3B8N0_CANTC|nr:uncharacterized protein CANTEDRAFT_108576 [Yamadazyma tenuis ATCC 10573]EGV61772.1 hypothetical protein CANTEDRAFT_108576 [Yamadazyma tenuis ATCC 10573]WEJ93001.1 clathrin associated protein complex medium subunit [Yamadazyma tenuis]